MLDINKVSLATNRLPAGNRHVEAGSTQNGASRNSGQPAPAGGTNLPVRPAVKAEPVELPEFERLAENISRFARSMNRDLTFSVHEASGQTVVTVLDGETKEVIRQIPSEEFLRISEAIASGDSVLLDLEA